MVIRPRVVYGLRRECLCTIGLLNGDLMELSACVALPAEAFVFNPNLLGFNHHSGCYQIHLVIVMALCWSVSNVLLLSLYGWVVLIALLFELRFNLGFFPMYVLNQPGC